MNGFGALRPSLERQEGRPAKGKQRLAAELARQSSRSAAGSSGRADGPVRRSPRAMPRTRPNPRARPCRRARLCECRRVRRPARPPRAKLRRVEQGRFSEWRRTQSRPRILSRGWSQAQAKRRLWLYPHVSHIGLYTNHLAPGSRVAQKLKCAPTRAKAAQRRRLSLDAAYSEVGDGVFRASDLTRGPWHPDHQHAGPPSALICRAIERVAAKEGLTHLATADRQSLEARAHRRLPVEVAPDYVGRNAGHFSGGLTAQARTSRVSRR